MDMMPLRSELLGRLLAELAIIVLGVLIALGAQSAFQEWTDRRDEHEFLLDLLEEFRANESQLQNDIGQTGRAVAAADKWRGNGASSIAVEDDSDADSYAASLNPARFDPISCSLRSLIDGGDLRLVRNRQLRAALAGWSDRTQEQVMTSVTVDMMRSMLMQFLIPEGQSAPKQALELDRLLLQVTYDQQKRLLVVLRQIIEMLEQEVGR
ncbi:MAG: hypothetical protein P8Y69_12780 [Gammaproteobacteria bacterium]